MSKSKAEAGTIFYNFPREGGAINVEFIWKLSMGREDYFILKQMLLHSCSHEHQDACGQASIQALRQVSHVDSSKQRRGQLCWTSGFYYAPWNLPKVNYVLVLNVPGLYPSGGHSSSVPFVYCTPILSIGRIYLFSYLGVDLSLPLLCVFPPLSLHGFSLYFNIGYCPYLGCVGSWPAVRIWHPFYPCLCCSFWCPRTQAFHPAPICDTLHIVIRYFYKVATGAFILYHHTTLCIPAFPCSLLCEPSELHEHLIYLSFHISNN